MEEGSCRKGILRNFPFSVDLVKNVVLAKSSLLDLSTNNIYTTHS